jgi:hypothetical protein
MVPMVGFGFMDNTVMIHAGHAIDLTMGVTFGLSTLAAAACGQVCSDVAGVTFGGVIEAAARRLGLPSPNFSSAQSNLPQVKRTGVLGAVFGVSVGCSLGLCNLLLIDSSQKEFQIAKLDDGEACDFTVAISNEETDDFTVIRIEGPATKGLLASVLQVLVANDIYVCEIQVTGGSLGEFKTRVLYVKKNDDPLDDEDLESVGRQLLIASKQPDKNNKLLVKNMELRKEVEDLRKRLADAQEALMRQQVIVKKRTAQMEGQSLQEESVTGDSSVVHNPHD